MSFLHEELSDGRWRNLSLAEQFANIGTEVGRTIRWKEKDQKIFDGACDRVLELFELTLADPRWNFFRLREIARVRELFCYAAFFSPEYETRLEDIDRYFFQFALYAREKNRM